MAYIWNMKFILTTLVCLMVCATAFAQKDSLQLDEANKYVYYRVVNKPGLNADTLYRRASGFAKMVVPKTKAGNVVDYAVVSKGKFLVYNGSSVVRKEGGEVAYTLVIETKDQKYRYKFSDFVFTPYVRDRFGNMVAVPGITVPVEKLTNRYSQKEADNFLSQIAAICKQTGSAIDQSMNKAVPVTNPETVKRISTGKW